MYKEKYSVTQEEEEIYLPVYTLGIASQLSGIPAHSIRQYIDRGLLLPYKLDSKRHLFSRSDISRIKHIHHLIHERGLNFAGIRALMAMVPCWAIRPCGEEDRRSCHAYTAASYPCWEASKKGRVCKNEDCRECEVYKNPIQKGDYKSLIRALI
jgi:MerR family transcriptional regulator/heat shock protein HspR